MADTNHQHPAGLGPVESDGVHYRGIVWFLVIMGIMVVGSQLLMVGAFKWLDRQASAADAPRSPLAAPTGQLPPGPNLQYELSGAPAKNEPGYLQQFLAKEDQALQTYTLDKATGAATIPIERAKVLVLQRGLPARAPAAPAAAPPAASPAASTPPADPAKAAAKAKDH